MDAFTDAHSKGVASMSDELKTLWQSVKTCVEASRNQMDSFAMETEEKRKTVQGQVSSKDRVKEGMEVGRGL